MSIDYYDDHAAAYVEQTLNVDMSTLYARFLPRIPEHGSILDAGCGSGRDAKAFQDRGFKVTAFDGSEAMCRHAARLLGAPVQKLKFNEVRWHQEFDGVWACASLLHVRQSELVDALARLLEALRAGGVLYASFKYGDGEHRRGGRSFLDMNEGTLKDVLADVPDVDTIETWRSPDRRPGRSHESWLNVIITKARQR